jgi:hypothetical protein
MSPRCSIVRSPLRAHSLIVGTPTLVSSAAASIVTKGWRWREGSDLSVIIITVGAMADLPHRPVGLRFHWRMATIDCPGDLGRLSAGLELPVLPHGDAEAPRGLTDRQVDAFANRAERRSLAFRPRCQHLPSGYRLCNET